MFFTIAVSGSATGNTWYDSLQLKGTKRLSHGIQVNGTFTWSKALVGNRPNLYVASDKSIQPTDQPFQFIANILYTTQPYFKNQMVRTAVKDWSLGWYEQWASGMPLTPPSSTTTNFIGGSEQIRQAGVPLYLKDLNCGCINPYQDQVLNPAAWTNPAAGTFGPATGTLYSDFRQARRPTENFNFGRTFKLKERYSLQIRAEFVNVFNRTQIGNPITTNPAAALTKNAAGQLNGGFGVINMTVSGANIAPTATANAAVGQLFQGPRTGTLIARFTF